MNAKMSLFVTCVEAIVLFVIYIICMIVPVIVLGESHGCKSSKMKMKIV